VPDDGAVDVPVAADEGAVDVPVAADDGAVDVPVAADDGAVDVPVALAVVAVEADEPQDATERATAMPTTARTVMGVKVIAAR
jgi:hypothetical protein